MLWRLNEADNIDKHRKLINIGNDILCEGDGFEGQYWLKGGNPPFGSIFGPERQQLPTIGSRIAEPEPLVPALDELTNFVEALIEDHFRVFLE